MPTYSICPSDFANELPIASAIEAIRRTFPYAVVNHERGRERALAVLDRLLTLNAPDLIQEVYRKGANEAVAVEIDAPPVEFMLMPGEGIQLSSRIVDAAFAHKLAKALGYECEEIG